MWIVLASIIGAMLACFLALQSMRATNAIEVRRIDPSRYAVPAEPPVDRTSAIGLIRAVSTEGW